MNMDIKVGIEPILTFIQKLTLCKKCSNVFRQVGSQFFPRTLEMKWKCKCSDRIAYYVQRRYLSFAPGKPNVRCLCFDFSSQYSKILRGYKPILKTCEVPEMTHERKGRYI